MKHSKTDLVGKCFYLVFALYAMISSVSGQSLAPQKLGSNLVKNSSFEEGAEGWKIPNNNATVVSDEAYDGKHSLCYTSSDPQKYILFSQEIAAQPGQRLHFSSKVRGKGLDASKATSIYSSGAGVYIESFEGSTFISGEYPAQYNGTFDWKEMKASYTVPTNATKVSVGVFLRKGVVGTAWFDDVQVRAELPPAYASFLRFPNYRGMVAQEDNSPWQFQVRALSDSTLINGEVNVTTTLMNSDKKILLEDRNKITISERMQSILFTPPKNLPLGEYVLVQRFENPMGRALFTNENIINIVKDMPRVYIDNDGFTVIEGQRFFPMGIYLSPTGEEHMKRVSEGGFNTIINYSHGDNKSYKDYMDRAKKYGLKVLYAINKFYPGSGNYQEDAYKKAADLIKGIRNEEALLAWYTNDEMPTSFIPRLFKGYNQVKELDPNHPTIQVLDKLDTIEQYFDTTDVVAPDPYPVGRRGSSDLTSTTEHTRAMMRNTHGAKSVWVVPQIMDWAVYRKGWKSHPPSLDEMRNQAYQALINGAKGLIWYSYYDLKYKGHPRIQENISAELFERRWNDVTRMAKEINSIIPAILEDDTVPLDLPQNAKVEVAAWKQGERLALVLANPYYEVQHITFPLPADWVIKDTNQETIKSRFIDGKATFILPEVGSGVFYLDRK